MFLKSIFFAQDKNQKGLGLRLEEKLVHQKSVTKIFQNISIPFFVIKLCFQSKVDFRFFTSSNFFSIKKVLKHFLLSMS